LFTAFIAANPADALLWHVMPASSYLAKTREALFQAYIHDVINTSKAAAYSGMLMFFPALLVITTLIAQVEAGPSFVGETRSVLEQFLPTDTLDLVQTSILNHQLHSGQLVLSATCLSLFAGMGVMLSLMEGFRRAYRLPPENWTFWGRRARALLLVFIVLIPLSVASLVIVFGHQIEQWMIANAGHDLRHIVILFWRMIRWAVSFAAILTVLSALYHFGTRRTERWFLVAPGAIAGTLIWFPATLAYGWYVTSVANYTRLYGSFAAGIATLVWLYITSFSVLLGAELNGVLYWERQNRLTGESSARKRAQVSR
jgi:membrane protein